MGTIEGNVDFSISGSLVGVAVLSLTVCNSSTSSVDGFVVGVSSLGAEEGCAVIVLIESQLAGFLFARDGCVAVGNLGVTTPMIFVGSGVAAGLDVFSSRFDTGNVNECVFNFVGVSLLLSAVKI